MLSGRSLPAPRRKNLGSVIGGPISRSLISIQMFFKLSTSSLLTKHAARRTSNFIFLRMASSHAAAVRHFVLTTVSQEDF